MTNKDMIKTLLKALEEISEYRWGDASNINDMDNTIEYMKAVADVAIEEAKEGGC